MTWRQGLFWVGYWTQGNRKAAEVCDVRSRPERRSEIENRHSMTAALRGRPVNVRGSDHPLRVPISLTLRSSSHPLGSPSTFLGLFVFSFIRPWHVSCKTKLPGFKDPTTERTAPPSDHTPLERRCAFL